MIFYAPKLFKYLAYLDNVDPFTSFDPDDNAIQIQNFSGPDGGKSGQFFFFTRDNSFILKTITDTEMKSF
jgi:1-phosphatidylinositol-4-phosphate 5-kinase